MSEATNPAAELDALVQAGAEVEANEGHTPEGAETEVQYDAEGNPIPPADDEPQEEDDSEDVEYEGKSFKAPKGIKDALLRQGDYTKKTQEVADQRRELDEGRKALLQQAQTQRELMVDAAKVVSLNEQLAVFDKYTQADWDKAHAADPDETARIWRNFQMLKSQRDTALSAYQAKERTRVETEQRNQRQAIEQRDTVLARDIKGWSAETRGKLEDFAAKEFGFDKAELASFADPRAWKVLARAMASTEAQKTQAKGAALAKTQATTPAKPVAATSKPVAKHQDEMSMDEWVKFERARMNKSGR